MKKNSNPACEKKPKKKKMPCRNAENEHYSLGSCKSKEKTAENNREICVLLFLNCIYIV